MSMRNRFDEQLHALNHELLEMGALIERAIRSATDALIRQDGEAALQALSADKEVDQAERDIEALCLKLLLQQQPVARDLRLISSVLKNDNGHGAYRRSGQRYCRVGNLPVQ